MSKIALEPIDAKHDQDAVDMESIWSALRKTLYRNHKSTPSMVLSVIGDSDSLVPRHWAKNVFQTALIEAAKSGGETWILYQGNGKGVSNLVRNAYLDYEVLEFGIKTVDISDSDRHIKLISIAEEKGIVYQEMKTETGPSHLKIALTTPEWKANQGEGEGTFLVDFGIFVSEQRSSFFGLNMDFKMPIPFAIIVCEGDIGTITYISKALQNNIPVIIMKGSGKVADLIVDFLNNPVGLIVKATILFGIDLNDTKFVQLEEFFQRIEKNRHIIGVFDLDQDNPLKLSSIIGDSIVNCGSRKPRSIKDVQEQLSTSKYFQQSCPRNLNNREKKEKLFRIRMENF